MDNIDRQRVPADMEQYMFEGPVPGQSLTNDPSNRAPWEEAPKFTSVKDAREKIFFDLTHPDRIESVQQLLINEVPVNTIAEVLLTQGFREGAFNPDMLMQLMEPTMVILMAIAEKSGIIPIVEGEDNDRDFDDDDVGMPTTDPRNTGPIPEQMLNKRRQKLMPKGNINPMAVGKDIRTQLDNLNLEKVEQSILQRPKPTGDMKSLLDRGE